MEALDETEFVTDEDALDVGLIDTVIEEDELVEALALLLALLDTEDVDDIVAVCEVLEEVEGETLGEMVDDPEFETLGLVLGEDDEDGLDDVLIVLV